MKRWAVLLILSLMVPVSSANEIYEPDTPAGLEMYWIARYMEFNDIPMSIQSFKTPEASGTLVPRLEEYLQAFGDEVQITQDRNGGTVLATANDSTFYSIQLDEQLRETEGVFTISAKQPAEGNSQQALPLGFVRVEKQKFFDGPSIQEFTVLATNAGQSEALAVVERMLRKQGWSTTRNYRSTRYFSRRSEHAQATAQPNEKGVGTLILISKELSK